MSRSRVYNGIDDLLSVDDMEGFTVTPFSGAAQVQETIPDSSIFKLHSWSKREEKAFYCGILRYSKRNPKAIACLIGSKPELSVRLMIRRFENFLQDQAYRVSCKRLPAFKHPAASVSAVKFLKKADPPTDDWKALPEHVDLFDESEWIFSAASRPKDPCHGVENGFFSAWQETLRKWLRKNLARVIYFSQERASLCRRRQRGTQTFITAGDVNAAMLPSAALDDGNI